MYVCIATVWVCLFFLLKVAQLSFQNPRTSKTLAYFVKNLILSHQMSRLSRITVS